MTCDYAKSTQFRVDFIITHQRIPVICVTWQASSKRISSGALSLRPFIVSTVHFRIINDVVGSNFRTRKSIFYFCFLLSIHENAKSQLDLLRGIFFNI